MSLLLALVAAPALLSSPPRHFDVSAAYVPRKGTQGDVAVTFIALDPDVHINRVPSPRLKLDPSQTALLASPPPPDEARPPAGAHQDKYLDVTFPVVFPVTRGAEPVPGPVRGTVTYFYCSKREGWCRKGTADVEFPLGAR